MQYRRMKIDVAYSRENYIYDFFVYQYYRVELKMYYAKLLSKSTNYQYQ